MKKDKPEDSNPERKRAKAGPDAPAKGSRLSRPAPAAKPKRASKANAPAEIPPILREGDAGPNPVSASGPGQRYAMGSAPSDSGLETGEAELPEAYGTKQLFLTARDPRWLYAHWDLTSLQLKEYNLLSRDGHLILRVFKGAVTHEPLAEIHVHPESRNWFIPVPDAGTTYLATLGYFDLKKNWITLANSGATLTPPDALAEESTIRFATIPHDIPFGQLLATVKTAVRQNLPLVEALQELRASGHSGLPALEEIQSQWTPAQESALAQIISFDHIRRIWVGSLEVTELVRAQLSHDQSSMGVAQFSLATSPGSLSSPFGGISSARGFWFNVNAELIVYGATEPDAKVTIGSREIKLRPDGTFSFRFALPDGEYALPVAARSSDGEEMRHAHMEFMRHTKYGSGSGQTAVDPQLKPPMESSVA